MFEGHFGSSVMDRLRVRMGNNILRIQTFSIPSLFKFSASRSLTQLSELGTLFQANNSYFKSISYVGDIKICFIFLAAKQSLGKTWSLRVLKSEHLVVTFRNRMISTVVLN